METVHSLAAEIPLAFSEISDDTTEFSRRLDLLVTSVADSDPELKNIIAAESFKSNITNAFDSLAASASLTSEPAVKAMEEIFGLLIRSLFKFFNLKAPKKESKGDSFSGNATALKDPFQDLRAFVQVYDVVLVYFFVAAGCTLLMMAILIVLGKKNKCLGDYVAIVLRATLGLGLAGIIAALQRDGTSLQRFLLSPWILPTALLAIGVVVLLDGVFGYFLPAPAAAVPKLKKSQENGGPKGREAEGKKYSVEYVHEDHDDV